MTDSPALPQVCVCYLMRTSPAGDRQVLLGRKKKGLGLGNIVGLGGKLEPGETATDAAVREIEEESGLVVAASALVPMGVLTYLFPHRTAWSQVSNVFTVTEWSGTPRESDELNPVWFDVATLPVDEMWDDARHWLPGVLAGTPVTETFTFAADLASVSSRG
ncbi:8-oxo-dGTP diphosphatase [Cryobacterium melibiosiphilum]|uniref:Oxidized purine nucleoside triphosphate hydrolase n=1 Tax=Cryobacterium melibiosiphilum TaxID=995039 RepID=A0A3A5MB81_9MICO|nr:8-oxo-dGTP diphosphatase [Cryobacterium melibiosiphilum]RJT87377.1 8-oxo-dGTP diphosphatase [Cryobacterium melibiosiphilum]